MNSAPSSPGRNDPCPCRSGKKFKHCCASASANSITIGIERSLDNARHCAFQLGDFEAAEQHYRQALTLNPNHIEALAGIAQILCRRHRRAEGKLYFDKAAKSLLRRAEKCDESELLGLAQQLQQWGNIESALPLYRAAAKRWPKSLPALHGLASCLHRLHQTDLAIATMQKLASADAGWQLQLALLEIDKNQFSQARQRLEQVAEGNHDPRHHAHAQMELAKIHDKEGRHDQAFAALETAFGLNRNLTEIHSLDANYVFDKVEQLRNGYHAGLLQRWQVEDFADHGPLPVFLLGFLRSGTTLLEQALSAHPGVLSSDENTLINELDAELARISGIQGDSAAALRAIGIEQAKQLRQYYWQRAGEEYGPQALQKIFINKTALNSIEIGLIACLFPEAKIIFALRDPRDVCLSCAMQAFAPSPATVNLLSWQGIARQYAAIMGLWLHFRDAIKPSYLELRYEDTVNDFEGSLNSVFALLGLDWNPQVARFHEKSHGKYISTPSFNAVSRPLYRDSLARWRPYATYFEGIAPLLRPFVEAFGYES
jgi:tetratricopeptide (TPR) repeat protein